MSRSRSTDPRGTRPSSTSSTSSDSADSGFSLVEVIVAIGLTMTVLVAVLPQLIVGIKGSAYANNMSAVKGAVQGHLEQLRNLPYYVAFSTERRLDLLDTYFPDLKPPATSPTVAQCAPSGYAKPVEGWKGYVTTQNRCGYEPPTGSFYRSVTVDGDYILVTNLQFLDSAVRPADTTYRPVLAVMPATVTDYDSRDPQGKDAPVSSQVGVTVTALYRDGGRLRAVSSYTQIAEAPRYPWRLQVKADAAAIDVASADQGATRPEPLSLRAGTLNVSGSLSRESAVTASLGAVSTQVGTGEPVGPFVGPLFTTSSTSSPAAGDLVGGRVPATTDCTYGFCWGATDVAGFAARAEEGLPSVGATLTPLTPLEARLTGALSFGNTQASLDPKYRPMLMLDPAKPLVSVSASSPSDPDVTANGCGLSKGGRVTGRGYAATTATSVDSCAEAATTKISLFPTTFAPKGVLRIRLGQAQARCTVDRATATATATYRYSIEVEYADGALTPAGGPTVYSTTGVLTGNRSLTFGGGTVESVPPNDVLQPLLSKTVGEGLTLGDYVESWSSPTAAMLKPTVAKSKAEAALPGVLSISSQPVRVRRDDSPTLDQFDTSSALSLTVGSVSCYSEDAR